MPEIWKPVPGFEGIYAISNQGDVRVELDRLHKRKGDLLAKIPQRDGYLFVGLCTNGKAKTYSIARLVLRTFAGEPKPGHQANHKDGNILNNHLDNLEWCSLQDNFRHSCEILGRDHNGEGNPCARMTEKEVLELRQRAATGEPYTALGEHFGITNVMARYIATGKAWSHVGGPLQGKRPIGRPPRGDRKPRRRS